MNKQRVITWLGILSSLILAALLLPACSANIPADTASPEASAATETATETGVNDVFGETNSPDALPADTEVDANGVPIGFTENGNPYRGNPNAPVVIEEFSDFQ